MYKTETVNQILQMHNEGVSSRKIAKKLKIGSKSTVNYIINRQGFRNVPKKGEGARILYIDIETAPCIAAVFGRFNINLSQANIIENGSQLISACWLWEGSDVVHGAIMTPEEAINRDDSRVVAEIYEAIESADILIYQNGDRFDLPKIKTRCILNGFPPPKTVKTVDTLKIAKQLGFPSNRLDSLGDYLGVGRKQENSGISLWIRCLNGDVEALNEMYAYNEQDVFLLRDVYLKIRAFDKHHPNVANYYNDDEKRCTVCGSEDVDYTGNSVYTQISEFKEVICNGCGHRMRERINVKSKEKKDNTLMNC